MGQNTHLSTLPADHFDGRLDEIRKILPPNTITAEALVRVVLTAMNKTPALRSCTQESILGCLLDIASIGLMPNTPHGFAYLIPYDGKATLQIGYKGFAELSYRTGEVKVIQADVVRDGDDFEYQKGANISQFVRHSKRIGKGRNEAEVLASWASVEMVSGGVGIEVMDADELAKIRKLASSRNKDQKESPAWRMFADEMYKKTALKRLLKVLQIGNMETVRKAIDIDNRDSGLIPGIDMPAKKEHDIVITDQLPEGSSMVTNDEPPVPKEESPAPDDDANQGDFW